MAKNCRERMQQSRMEELEQSPAECQAHTTELHAVIPSQKWILANTDNITYILKSWLISYSCKIYRILNFLFYIPRPRLMSLARVRQPQASVMSTSSTFSTLVLQDQFMLTQPLLQILLVSYCVVLWVPFLLHILTDSEY